MAPALVGLLGLNECHLRIRADDIGIEVCSRALDSCSGHQLVLRGGRSHQAQIRPPSG